MSFKVETTTTIPNATRTRAKSELRTALEEKVGEGQNVFIPVEYFGDVTAESSKRSLSNTARSAFGKGNYAVRDETVEGVVGYRVYNTTEVEA